MEAGTSTTPRPAAKVGPATKSVARDPTHTAFETLDVQPISHPPPGNVGRVSEPSQPGCDAANPPPFDRPPVPNVQKPYAPLRPGSIGNFGWTIVSMKDDWRTPSRTCPTS